MGFLIEFWWQRQVRCFYFNAEHHLFGSGAQSFPRFHCVFYLGAGSFLFNRHTIFPMSTHYYTTNTVNNASGVGYQMYRLQKENSRR